MRAADEYQRVLRDTLWGDDWPSTAHGTHHYDARCAVCRGDVAEMAQALAADPGVRAAVEREVRAEALEVCALLLGKVRDYWDGRPAQHHGHHIYADLLDVLKGIEADARHNRQEPSDVVADPAPCCPGAGTMAHVRGCVSHPEFDPSAREDRDR